MKANVYTAPGQFAYMEVPIPTLKPDEVLIAIKACGLCRTDMHIHLGHFLADFPLINGHEFTGEIAEVGADVVDFQVGDRVVADNTELCGYCEPCRADKPLYCQNFVSHGCNTAGGFADYLAIKAEKTFKIENLSYREAIMVEPTACAIHGMDVIDLTPGSEVILFGAGPTGLILTQLLKQNGAVHLTVAAPPGPKLDLAAKLGADEVIPIDKKDYSKHRAVIKEGRPGGFDTVIEATGVSHLFEETINYTKMGGQIIAYGVYPEEDNVAINPYDLFMRELTIKGSFAQTHCFDRALRYLESGQVKVSDFVTHEVPVADYGHALELMDSGEAVKIALVP